jgi:hypothetical protein
LALAGPKAQQSPTENLQTAAQNLLAGATHRAGVQPEKRTMNTAALRDSFRAAPPAKSWRWF